MNDLNNVFRILSDETRLRIVLLLAQDKLCVCQISGILDLSPSLVSKHLSKLRDLNFVNDERKDRFVFYSLVESNLILKSITNDILNNVHEFPQLILDQSRIKDKEQFFANCMKNN